MLNLKACILITGGKNMNLETLTLKNLLICGETGSGKTYLLTLLINKIMENKDSNSLIYISDPKLFCFRRFINNKDILNYDENELVKIVNDRLEKLKDNPKCEFSDIYVVFDEVANELFLLITYLKKSLMAKENLLMLLLI